MKAFKDNKGREWQIVIHVAAIKRVRDLIDLNLLEVVEGKLIERLIADPVLLCDAIYALCKPDADEKGITDIQFGESMAGNAIENATKAVLEELVSFFGNPRDRANLTRILELSTKTLDRARTLNKTRLESGIIEKAINHQMDEAVAKVDALLGIASGSSGNAPESSESTQAA